MARFEDVKAGFWGAGEHGVQPPLTDEALRNAERVLGVALPAALLELLRLRNGGPVAAEYDTFPNGGEEIMFDQLMGIGPRNTNLLDTPYLIEEWGMPAPVVLLSGDGHYWVALDYRGPSAEPPVTLFDNDFGTEVVLAPDFRSFVEGLGSRTL